MDKDKNEFWIRDYFGPYPINWDLYDIVMGRKPGDNKIELKDYLTSDEYKNFFEKNKK
jgi:hypothetical protein